MEKLKLLGGLLLLIIILWITYNVVAILIMLGIKIYELNNQFLEWLGDKLLGGKR